ncbi:MAG: DUF4365 domain-containing protein [Sediminibacterium sp.]|nr:DUF4365 domain-containing protein [Sediminibacterium sp.]
MRPLSTNDIESELSYAYLHAVASKAGASCIHSSRTMDGNGIDAIIIGWAPFPNGAADVQEISIYVQLKATIEVPNETDTHFSYFIKGIDRYNDLRANTISTHRILVVLFLPNNAEEWINITSEEFILKKCAYWVSLNGASASTNLTGETIYLPKTQIMNSENLTQIFAKLSRNEVLTYKNP